MLDPVRWITTDNKILDKYNDTTQILPGKLRLIDQTLLPEELVYLETDEIEVIFDSIKRLVVRGAPAIGCSAALGLASVAQHFNSTSKEQFLNDVKKAADRLAESRPTAVNLFWALNRCTTKLTETTETDIQKLKEALLHEALDILEEDIKMCKSIGQHGAPLIKDGMGLITHCNAGALATSDYGTALSPMYVANEQEKSFTVYSDETRPLLQGSRLTAWELNRAGVNVVTICDNMAAQVMKEGKIDLAIVGSDRIAANGDAANKIGTYGLAILAKYHNIPFYVAAPYSTIDMELCHGDLIPIEKRGEDEIKCGFGKRTAPAEVAFYNPAFDVTPNDLIAGIITERGILRPPYTEAIAELFSK
jgi:methylthioribose-1-phosphate isomerase